MRKTLAVAAVAAALAATGDAAGGLRARDLIGRWASPAPENLGQIYGTRAFVMTERAWALEFRAFADAAGQVGLFALRVEGTYALLGASRAVPGATEANFRFGRRYLTASASGAGLFAPSGCALEPGVERDVSADGCGFVPSVRAAPVEYDLVRLDGDRLFFGDRSGDLGKARPERLGADPVVRR